MKTQIFIIEAIFFCKNQEVWGETVLDINQKIVVKNLEIYPGRFFGYDVINGVILPRKTQTLSYIFLNKTRKLLYDE